MMMRQALIVLMCHTLATHCQTWQTSNQNGKVVFVLSGGNQATFRQLWPNASVASLEGNSAAVVLNSNNMQLTIADVIVKLASLNNDTTIRVRPYAMGSDTSVGTLVFVLNTTDKTLVQTLWPNAVLLETSAMNTTVTLATTNDPDQDMRSLMMQLPLKAKNFSVLVNPYLKLDLKDGPASICTGTLVFVLNTTNSALIQALWPTAVLDTSSSPTSTTVKLATTDDPTQDLRALRIKLLRSGNITVLVDPYFIPDPPADKQVGGMEPYVVILLILGVGVVICILVWVYVSERKRQGGYGAVANRPTPSSNLTPNKFPTPPPSRTPGP